jgi:biopolymer transport protein ExbB
MFEGKSILDIFSMGGITMYILLICSMVSLAVIIERIVSYGKKSKPEIRILMDIVAKEISKNGVDTAIRLCGANPSPAAEVVRAGLKKHGHEEKEVSGAMEREIMVQTVLLEQYTGIVGTIGNTAVYIGLFGTVLGIIRSFHNIASVGSGGISVVIGGVAESLICTATGLLVAIPAVIAYNYFMRRVDNFIRGMEYCASETLELIGGKAR